MHPLAESHPQQRDGEEQHDQRDHGDVPHGFTIGAGGDIKRA
jgi:hypothetical protein